MNKAKALLDSLMGPSRNLSAKERSGEDFKRPDVCKNYLAGFCPEAHVSFIEIDKGKVEITPPVPCTKLHSKHAKAELEKHPEAQKYKRQYEDALLIRLEDIATEALARAAVEKRRCRPKDVPPMPESMKTKWDALDEERKKMLAEAEEKEKAGDTAGSLEAKRLAQRCQSHLTALEGNAPQGFPGEEVCKYCGYRMILGGPKTARASEHVGEGAAAWEEEHVISKCHIGFVEIHERLAKLRETVRARRESEPDKEEEKGDAGRRGARSRSRKARSRSRRGGGRGGREEREREKEKEDGGRRRSREKGGEEKEKEGSGRRRSRERGGEEKEKEKDDGGRKRSREKGGEKRREDRREERREGGRRRSRSRSRSRKGRR